jgi:uncharacterized MAPEG superfamily protein
MSMPTELLCLLILALWSLPLNHLPAIARISSAGVEWGLSNRDKMPEVPGWVGRADRAQRNHHDNLAMIGVILLMAVVLQKTDAITQIAAIVILLSRMGHGVFYVAGIGLLRSLSYAVSILALFAVVWRLFV